jgi:hypothetical protein
MNFSAPPCGGACFSRLAPACAEPLPLSLAPLARRADFNGFAPLLFAGLQRYDPFAILARKMFDFFLALLEIVGALFFSAKVFLVNSEAAVHAFFQSGCKGNAFFCPSKLFSIFFDFF